MDALSTYRMSLFSIPRSTEKIINQMRRRHSLMEETHHREIWTPKPMENGRCGRFSKTNEPFVLVDQVSQVFYVDDNSNKGLQVVRKTRPHDSHEIADQTDDIYIHPLTFKMKPLKIENEVDSNLKNTIIYTFVAPAFCILYFILEEVLQGRSRDKDIKTLPCPLVRDTNDA
uniref:DUF4216 domain-containing protein n=1 Tax=Solanum lycopersicum TaxID=4081 RepID=A0A3Q7JC40_SOLLC